MEIQSVVMDFYSSWGATGKVDRKFFTEDFVFLGPSSKIDADAWLLNSDEELPMEKLVLIDAVETETGAALSFEYIDPVTLLTYRTAWFARISSGKISRLIEVRQSIQGM
jgi:hypothetical protein